jgi:4-oxalmesaconate hydratase
LIIDVHGHYTTAPDGLWVWRARQLTRFANPTKGKVNISDESIRRSIDGAQLNLQRERGTDIALFSPVAGAMAHHIGNELISRHWTEVCNDLIYRVTQLYPGNFAGVCMLPQSPGVSPATCVGELTRCVEELGFVACNLNPDPSGGYWTAPPLTDRYWYPLYERLVELGVPAMIHVASSCNPVFHGAGAHYINADTSAFMQFIEHPELFEDFPTLKIVIPHAGGAVPFHWGRYRGLALGKGLPELNEWILDNVFFDSCVYQQEGMELLFKTVGVDNVLFGSEMLGAVPGKDPKTERYFDDAKQYIDAISWLADDERKKLFETNARKVYPRLDRFLTAQGR